MWIPTKLYEALPAIYLTTGLTMILCALYIGMDAGLMVGYVVLGSGCVFAGILVHAMRFNARVRARHSQS